MNTQPRPRILIADDSLDNIEFLGNVLGGEFDICFATSGEEALGVVAENHVELILLDCVMPGMSGFEVCQRLKSNATTRDIPVIFLTSLDGTVDEESALSLGAVDFVHKPVSPSVVGLRVRNQIMLSRARKQLQHHNEELEQLVEERTREIVDRERRLVNAQTAAISTLCAVVEARDKDTGGHIWRTQSYIEELAKQLRDRGKYQERLSEDIVQMIVKSAPLHDIGKVAVPDAILLKPGKLSPEEWAIMKSHCVIGRDIMLSARHEHAEDELFFKYATEIAYCHHERWDGAGYPRGLIGEEIPLCARLMAVADVYDALRTKRIYKTAYTQEESLRLMKLGRETQFDPELIDAFIAGKDRFYEISLKLGDY